MSIILAIESSTDTASVALHGGQSTVFTNGKHVLTQQVSGVQTHSQTILPMVQILLAQAGMTLSQCHALAFGAGPGSFTGVRTACGIVQGLGYGCDLPVIAVDTLAAAALACHEVMAGAGTNDIVVALDARMGEVYWGQYRFEPTRVIESWICPSWEVIVAPRLSQPNAVVPIGKVSTCGNAYVLHAAAMAACPVVGSGWPQIMPHAAQVATLAQGLLSQAKAVAARHAQPFYLRNDVALTTAERARKQLEAVR